MEHPTIGMPPKEGRRSLRITVASNGFILNVTEEGPEYKCYDMVFLNLSSLMKAIRTFLGSQEDTTESEKIY